MKRKLDCAHRYKNFSEVISAFFRVFIRVFPLLLLATWAIKVEAATLYFVPSEQQIYQGDEFQIELRIDTEGETINALEADINFSSDIMEVGGVGRVNSFLRLWPKEPTFSNALGIISLAGGLPNPGFSGPDGFIGTIQFKAKREGRTELRFGSASRALLNTGDGREAGLKLRPLILAVATPPPSYEPRRVTPLRDTTPPQPFIPIITHEESLFDGKYFVVFSTDDFGSGISHYEVQEYAEGKWGEWRVAVSPHVLENQEGIVRVFVKAVDNAGNEIIGMSEVNIPKKKLPIGLLIMLLLVIVVAGITIIRKYVRSSLQ